MLNDDGASDVPPVVPPIPAAVVGPAAWQAQQPPGRRSLFRRVMSCAAVLLILSSVVMNVYLVMLLGAVTRGDLDKSVVRDGRDDQVVAVYSVIGLIDGKAASRFSAFYHAVRDDENVKAVVIRVDSPGGGVSASDQIHQMVSALRNEYGKKVVISMGGVAASGGYYISAPGDTIYAEPTTITGSIGVIMPLPVIKGFLDKYGIDMVFIRSKQSQRWKAAINYFEQPDEEVLKARQALLTAMHAKFEQVVRSGRGSKLKTTEVEVHVRDFDGREVTVKQTEPLNGRVYMADAALRRGLVDKIGYTEDAIDAAAELAALGEPKVVQYSQRRTLRERMGFSDVSTGINAEVVERYLTPQPMLLWQGR